MSIVHDRTRELFAEFSRRSVNHLSMTSDLRFAELRIPANLSTRSALT
jgi:hypothetical protein